MNDEVKTLFPKPLFISNLSLINEEIEVLKNVCEKETYDINRNNFREDQENITQASKDKNILKKIELNFLKTKILEKFNLFKNNVMKYENKFVITRSWLTQTKNKSESNWHRHSNCMFSGVFYCYVDDTSDIVFSNFPTDGFSLNPIEYNLFNSESYFHKPKNFDLIFFPANLYHKIRQNNSNFTRYSLAFNFLPVGDLKYPNEDSYLQLNLKNI